MEVGVRGLGKGLMYVWQAVVEVLQVEPAYSTYGRGQGRRKGKGKVNDRVIPFKKKGKPINPTCRKYAV